MTLDIMRYLEIPLPEDVEKAKWCGDFDRAQRLIDRKLREAKLPFAAQKRLELEREILKRMRLDYCYSEEEGLHILQEHIPDFTREELQDLEDSSAIDWIYVNGKPHFCSRFYDTLIKVYPDIAKRAGEPISEENKEIQLLNDVIAEMQQQGFAARKIHLRAGFQIADSAFRPGEPLMVHLPIPTPAINMRDIRILSSQPEGGYLAPENAGQRTICFTCAPTENKPFTVEYEYVSRADYHVLDPDMVSLLQPDFDTQEQAPHIRFTPFIKALCQELSAGEQNPLKLARRFYDYCTTAVTYSYMREYFTLTQIDLLLPTCGRCVGRGLPAAWGGVLGVKCAAFLMAPIGRTYRESCSSLERAAPDPWAWNCCTAFSPVQKWLRSVGRLAEKQCLLQSTLQSE